LTRRGWHKAVGRGRATGLRSARKESGEGGAAHREGERAFDPLKEGAGFRPAGKGGPLEPMQAVPLVASDVFTMSSLSIGVRSSAGVARGF